MYNGSPLQGAQVTVGDTDGGGVLTDEEGFVEVLVPEDCNEVSVQISQQRWASKSLAIESGEKTPSHRLNISQSELNTGAPNTQDPASSQTDSETNGLSSTEDQPDTVVSKILRDIDRLGED